MYKYELNGLFVIMKGEFIKNIPRWNLSDIGLNIDKYIVSNAMSAI